MKHFLLSHLQPLQRDGTGGEPEEPGSGAPVPVPPKRTVKRNLPEINFRERVSSLKTCLIRQNSKVKVMRLKT
jgi:hypothetical protein